jgi:hypothetical protein
VALFGGFGLPNGDSNLTFTWDGHNWTQQNPANSAPTRQFPAMAYDSAHGNVVLFGGVGPAAPLGDTWVWGISATTGKLDWTQVSSSGPSARATAMAFDAGHGQVVLFSGNLNNNETWVWDGSGWSIKAPQNSPSARTGHKMAYDPARQKVVLFGGSDGCRNPTWRRPGNSRHIRRSAIKLSSKCWCMWGCVAKRGERQPVITGNAV